MSLRSRRDFARRGPRCSRFTGLSASLAERQADHHGGAGAARPTVDLIARLVAAKFQEALGQTVIVDNRGGANGMIGSAVVAHAPPDGYTLLAATPASHVTAVHLMKNLPVDPVKDFTPIMAAVEPVTALVVNAELPVNSVQELIAYAKANPGKLSYGSSGIGSVFHLTGELFNRTAGVNITHVPYRGVSQPMQDTAAGTSRWCTSRCPARAARSPRARPRCWRSWSRSATPGCRTCRRSPKSCRRSASRRPGSDSSVRPTCRRTSSRGSAPRCARPSPRPRCGPSSRRGDLTIIADTPEEFAALQKEGIEQFGEIIKAAGIKPQ